MNVNRLLVLSCCAPCSCAVIKHLAQMQQSFAVLFYNPNIRPVEEYQKRLDENKRVCDAYGVPFIELEYDNDRWCDAIQGLENEPERGARCDVCFYLRLLRACQYAKENGFDAVTSVLGVSRYKDFDQVNCAGQKASDAVGVPYLPINWRKGGLEAVRQSLVKELDLYAQTYCGCHPRA